jgi:hypothetical protein
MSYLLRVELPDVPGSLGALATAIGAAGGDIEAIEIVERLPNGVALDDVLLELPPSALPDKIVSACQRLDGVRVKWISRYAAGASLRMDLEAVEVLTASPKRAYEHLVDVVPETFRGDWAMGLRRGADGPELVRATETAPDVPDQSERWLDIERAQRLDAVPGWNSTVLAAAPLDGTGEIVVFGRRGGPEVLDSELARLGHLAVLAASVRRSVT